MLLAGNAIPAGHFPALGSRPGGSIFGLTCCSSDSRSCSENRIWSWVY